MDMAGTSRVVSCQSQLALTAFEPSPKRPTLKPDLSCEKTRNVARPPFRIAKWHGLAPSPTALLALLITCCPALAVAAWPNMAGDYVGQVENAGKLDKVVTSLRWSGKDTLSGTYVLTDQNGETKGRLKDCKRLHSHSSFHRFMRKVAQAGEVRR